MQSSSVEKILSSLPENCLSLSQELIIPDKKYYLSDPKIHHIGDRPQGSWWYFVFINDEFFAAASTIPRQPRNSLWDPFIRTINIICLPRSEYNEIFYTYDNKITYKSTIYTTIRELPEGVKRYWTTQGMIARGKEWTDEKYGYICAICTIIPPS